jgi:hypothetical protein
MVDAGNARFGPHTAKVEELLNWIDSGELLRFGKPLSGLFIPVADFKEALALAIDSQVTPGRVNWTELRENAETALYEIGLMDTPPWLPYKAEIDNLLSLVANRVEAALPESYLAVIDDVIADLNACARCLAVHGRLDPFHELLWQAYACGGWPCGCTGEPAESDDELHLEDRKFYVFWRRST